MEEIIKYLGNFHPVILHLPIGAFLFTLLLFIYGKFSKIEDVSLEDWNLHMDINLRASFLISQAFIPKMKKLKKGMLIFINSV